MHNHSGGISLADFVSLFLLTTIAFYLAAALRPSTRPRWPRHRIIFWITGCLVAALSVQVAIANHDDFASHAIAHVGLGMLAPLLLMLSAPVTLALRSLSPIPARRLARMLRSRPVRFVTHPVTAAILYIGGLWLLYAGGLYPRIHENGFLFAVVHVHVFASGYLFSAAIAGVDPNPHRARFLTRAIVLCAVMAGHSILSKHVFGNPPAGVPDAAAEVGSMVMYYGGDVVSVALVVLLCAEWYRQAGHARNHARLVRRPSPI
ncbi:cytochrome c oxidase assembly protein [Mycetocola miduiensis]|uniref:Putative membrane protein n=1 Tax=Mycetocola miduiensis TaxID=995034 RepID=A0A1I5AGL2_9MICO|nr:cytochrome c oxidase assembly protein [Mycetocola miduiensis]SFN61575.1 putative membrane protein [Mycetocola miduiensis]